MFLFFSSHFLRFLCCVPLQVFMYVNTRYYEHLVRNAKNLTEQYIILSYSPSSVSLKNWMNGKGSYFQRTKKIQNK